MATFMPGARISQAHGTVRPVDPATGARSALVFAMYHPAAALRTPAIERESYADIAMVPAALIDARRRREAVDRPAVEPAVADAIAESTQAVESAEPDATDHPPGCRPPADDPAPQLTLF